MHGHTDGRELGQSNGWLGLILFIFSWVESDFCDRNDTTEEDSASITVSWQRTYSDLRISHTFSVNCSAVAEYNRPNNTNNVGLTVFRSLLHRNIPRIRLGQKNRYTVDWAEPGQTSFHALKISRKSVRKFLRKVLTNRQTDRQTTTITYPPWRR